MNTLDPKKLTDTECMIANSLQSEENFIIPSCEMPSVVRLAECCALSVINVKLNSLEDLKGKVVIHTETDPGYFDYECDWAKPIINNPDTRFLVLFEIGERTDCNLIAKLSSYLDAHAIGMGSHVCANFFSGLIFDGDGSNIPSSIRRLCTDI